MRSDAPPLMPIFRSRHQADLLTWLLLHPDQEYTVTELADRLDVPLTTLHREAQRLVNAEILRGRTVGRARLLKANPDHPAAPALTRLLEVTFGPHTVIEDEFADLARVHRVLIYGSWAARYHGEPGRAPNDLDVLVIGSPDRDAVDDAAERAERVVDVPVQATVRSRSQWMSAKEAFVQQVKARPLVVGLVDETDAKLADDLRGLAAAGASS